MQAIPVLRRTGMAFYQTRKPLPQRLQRRRDGAENFSFLKSPLFIGTDRGKLVMKHVTPTGVKPFDIWRVKEIIRKVFGCGSAGPRPLRLDGVMTRNNPGRAETRRRPRQHGESSNERAGKTSTKLL